MLDRFEIRFERLAVNVVRILLMMEIALTVVALLWLLAAHGLERAQGAQSVPDMQALVLRGFGGALLVLLGLELLESLKAFFLEHHVRVELILIVSTIAVGRHMILLDFEHVNGLLLIGIAALMLSLTGGFFLVRRTSEASRPADGTACPSPTRSSSA